MIQESKNELTFKDMLKLGLPDEEIIRLFSLMPDGLRRITKGGIHMSVNINNSYNNNSGNLNSFSQDTTQQQNSNADFDDAFTALMSVISELEIQKREEADYLAEQIKLAYQDRDASKASRPLKILKDILGCIAPIISIAKIFSVAL